MQCAQNKWDKMRIYNKKLILLTGLLIIKMYITYRKMHTEEREIWNELFQH